MGGDQLTVVTNGRAGVGLTHDCQLCSGNVILQPMPIAQLYRLADVISGGAGPTIAVLFEGTGLNHYHCSSVPPPATAPLAGRRQDEVLARGNRMSRIQN